MNWKSIKYIYCRILIHKDKIEYLGGDKYRLTSYYSPGKKCWAREYQNEQLHGKYESWYLNGQKMREEKYQNGR